MSIARQFLLSLSESPDQAVRTARMRTAVDAGVSSGFFLDEIDRLAWDIAYAHFIRYGVGPSADLLAVEAEIDFPAFVPEEPFEFWLDRLLAFTKHLYLHNAAADVLDALSDGDLQGAEDLLQSAFVGVSKFDRDAAVFTQTQIADAVMEAHARLQAGNSTPGVCLGFPYIDAQTGGAQPGDSWTIVGRPGGGKTFLLCKWAMHAASPIYSGLELVHPGHKVLMVSMEMPLLQVVQRNLAIGALVGASNLRLGRLSRFALNQLTDFVARIRTSGEGDRFLLMEGRLNLSVDDIVMKVREHRPDIVFVDGAYMVKPSRGAGGRSAHASWESAMYTMEGIKQLAMNEGIPVISSYQFSRKGSKDPGLDSIAYTDAVAQLASVVIGISNETSETMDQFENKVFKVLTLLKGRNGESGEVRVEFMPGNSCIMEIASEERATDPDTDGDPAEDGLQDGGRVFVSGGGDDPYAETPEDTRRAGSDESIDDDPYS